MIRWLTTVINGLCFYFTELYCHQHDYSHQHEPNEPMDLGFQHLQTNRFNVGWRDVPHKKSIKIPLVHLPKRGHWIELRHQLVPIQGRRLDVGMGPMGAQYLKNIDHVIGSNPCPINHQQLNKGTGKKNMSMYPCFLATYYWSNVVNPYIQ